MVASLLYGLAVFVAAAIGDVIWAKWTLHVNKNHAIRAANFAGLIPLMGIVFLNGYLHSYWFVMATASGCWAGTYLTVKRTKPHDG